MLQSRDILNQNFSKFNLSKNKKESIVLEDVILSNKQVRVTGGCTVFANINNKEIIDIGDLLSFRTSLVQKIKNQEGLSVKFNLGIKKKLIDLRSQYENEVAAYRMLFNDFVAAWKDKVKDGIYVGFCNDETLNCLGDIENRLRAYWYRNSVISQVEDIELSLKNIENKVRDYLFEDGCTMVVCL